MPIVGVSRVALFKRLEVEYTDRQFEDICFEFGIEIDDIAHEDKDGNPMPEGDVLYKFDIPANRYDLLCLEGIARALRLFLGKDSKLPNYRIVKPSSPVQLLVKPAVAAVRPVVVAAILRDITFTPESYASFIELQEKLHQNICRRRTLASVGTHDLDTVSGPFTYTALPKKGGFTFVPLRQTESVDGEGMMALLESDLALKPYLPIIRDFENYPVILDSKKTVCSVPPIINGQHSKITLNTKNVFIEVTATDRTKACIVLDTITTMFGEYTKNPFEVEAVEVVSADKSVVVTPDFTPRSVDATLAYLNSAVGVEIDPSKVVGYLQRMSVPATLNSDKTVITTILPPTRSDIIHACDVMEDVAIGYGFNKILAAAKVPPTNTSAVQLPINKLGDQLRGEIAQAGYTEVLTLSLCSTDENYKDLRQKEDGKAVVLGNPKSREYQVARTSLIPGLLKTARHNKHLPLPWKLFEISDVIYQDATTDVGARNERELIALYSNTKAGFEFVHGLLDRLMLLLEIPSTPGGGAGYSLAETSNPTYFDKRCAEITVNGTVIGQFGVVHPEVLVNFELDYPVSLLQVNVEVLLSLIDA
eukprot:TRINITY_DN73_c9_g1_i1.p1 TRINITY_DN73_c9_g1~~TRINITY_DN73_c9_g1_i1.p1  ORF type:complete len:608 (+),score=184.57 TRINITY_DN73_c9_g1_i1:57-1826(+)